MPSRVAAQSRLVRPPLYTPPLVCSEPLALITRFEHAQQLGLDPGGHSPIRRGRGATVRARKARFVSVAPVNARHVPEQLAPTASRRRPQFDGDEGCDVRGQRGRRARNPSFPAPVSPSERGGRVGRENPPYESKRSAEALAADHHRTVSRLCAGEAVVL